MTSTTGVNARGAAAGISPGKVNFSRDTFTFRFRGAPARYVDEFRTYYGPTMNAFEATEKNGKAGELRDALVELFESQNQSGRSDLTVIPATFLRVTVAR